MRIALGPLGTAALLALAMLMAGCGGGVAGVGAPIAAVGGDTTGTTAVVGSTETTTEAESASGNSFSSLPSIPLDSGTARDASAEGDAPVNASVLGKDYLQMQGGTVDGNALLLASGPAVETGPPDLAYAIYQVSGLSAGRPLSLNVECLPGDLGEGYYIGVANYTLARWSWFGPVTVPEFQLDLSKRDHRFVTQLDNLYFMLVCPPDTSITHSRSTVVMGSGSGPVQPGIGHGLRASDGGLDHQIALEWEPGAGAESYEVWRRPAVDGSQWTKLGEATAAEYLDSAVPNNRYFLYRVRALNAGGPAAYSGVDSGWSGLDAPRRITGNVKDAAGQPLAGVPVELNGYGPDMQRRTREDGTFAFEALAPGRYAVSPLPRTIDFAPRFLLADVTEQGEAVCDFIAHPAAEGALVWGFVLTPNRAEGGSHLLPVPGVAITLTDADDAAAAPLTATTDEHGFYSFPNLPHGPFKVSAAQVEGGLFFAPPQHRVHLGPQNTRERASFIGLPEAPGGGNPPPGGGDPPPGGGDPPPGGGDPPPGGGGGGRRA